MYLSSLYCLFLSLRRFYVEHVGYASGQFLSPLSKRQDTAFIQVSVLLQLLTTEWLRCFIKLRQTSLSLPDFMAVISCYLSLLNSKALPLTSWVGGVFISGRRLIQGDKSVPLSRGSPFVRYSVYDKRKRQKLCTVLIRQNRTESYVVHNRINLPSHNCTQTHSVFNCYTSVTTVSGRKVVPSRSSGWPTPSLPLPCVVASSSLEEQLSVELNTVDRLKCCFPIIQRKQR